MSALLPCLNSLVQVTFSFFIFIWSTNITLNVIYYYFHTMSLILYPFWVMYTTWYLYSINCWTFSICNALTLHQYDPYNWTLLSFYVTPNTQHWFLTYNSQLTLIWEYSREDMGQFKVICCRVPIAWRLWQQLLKDTEGHRHHLDQDGVHLLILHTMNCGNSFRLKHGLL